jgi:hypothetical protein
MSFPSMASAVLASFVARQLEPRRPPRDTTRMRPNSAGTERERQMHATDRPETPFHRVKVATFNVNNVNRRLPNLLDWLRAEMPDAVCLQELKADNAAFPGDALLDAGYHAVRRGGGPGTGWPFWPAARNRS